MIEALAAAQCVGRAWTSCADRTAFIGCERAAPVRSAGTRPQLGFRHRSSAAQEPITIELVELIVRLDRCHRLRPTVKPVGRRRD
jgi:hypothetical protein